jgi:hypothetical protein
MYVLVKDRKNRDSLNLGNIVFFRKFQNFGIEIEKTSELEHIKFTCRILQIQKSKNVARARNTQAQATAT